MRCPVLFYYNNDNHDLPLCRHRLCQSTSPPKVFSIVNEEPSAEEAKAKVKAYEEANRSQIVIRQSQRADEERSIADR